MFKGKITVVGAGNVGSTIAYTLMISGLVSEIVLIDVNRDKAEGDAMDMNHGVSFVNPVKISSGDYCDIKGSDNYRRCEPARGRKTNRFVKTKRGYFQKHN